MATSRRAFAAMFVIASFLVFSAGELEAQDGASTATIWTGDRITFTKSEGSDPNQAVNQDRLTDSVWITRRNEAGQIYNVVESSRPNQRTSPLGTRWAFGTTADLDNLEFGTFRGALGKPKDLVGRDLVLHIVEEDIYIDLRFTQWSVGKDKGGFAYERSTPE